MQFKPITVDSHPRDIAVITASTMREAVIMADRYMRQPDINGVVWHRPQVRLVENPAALVRVFEQALGKPASGTQEFSNGPVVPGRSDGNITIWGKNAAALLDEERLTDLEDLDSHFNRVGLSIRIQGREKIHWHYDGRFFDLSGARVSLRPSPEKFFSGEHIRIVRTDNVFGTFVLDMQGAYIEESLLSSYNLHGIGSKLENNGWTVALGDYLFVPNQGWHPRKPLLHSAPEYDFSEENIRRYTTVYDCAMV